MGLLERLVELARGRGTDQIKAQRYVAEKSSEAYQDLVADFDAFVCHQAAVEDPALTVGTARDSSGRDIEVRVPFDELYCHWLVSGGTGTGKTTFVTSVVADMLRTDLPSECSTASPGSSMRPSAGRVLPPMRCGRGNVKHSSSGWWS